MAAASGPVEATSGCTGKMDEFKLPEAPSQKDSDKANTGGFKLPSTTGLELRKPESSGLSKQGDKTEHKSQTFPKKVQPTGALPSERSKQTQVSVPYKEPIWGGIPPESEKYSFDVLKNGTVVDNVELDKKPWYVFGRLPSCDVCMEHPSLSRHHAVVQYRDTVEDGNDRGWYLYDLDSTHGTWVNKEKVKPSTYRRLRVGHVVKFGGSTRLYILQGPEEDQEPESELSVTELKEQTAKLKREAEMLKQAELNEEEERERQRQKILELRGCSWGMGEDATEESEENPFPVTNLLPQHEHLYSEDPKKALKGFYEREGCDLPDYQFTEVGFGKHKCVVELPVDGPNGETLIAEATVSGKKKDAVVACALEACRLLDIHGMLHASKHESRRRKGKNWEDDDYYDSDEDTFLDRTGSIEKKRIFRMQKSGKESKAETYESLLQKYEEVKKRIDDIEYKLEQAKAQTEAAAGEEDDALEAYMTAIKAGVMDTKTRLSLKRELLTLRTDEQRLRKLVNLAKPAEMPELKKLDTGMKKATISAGVTSGVRKIATVKGPKKLPLHLDEPVQPTSTMSQEEEEDEEEEDVPSEIPKTVATKKDKDSCTQNVPNKTSAESQLGAESNERGNGAQKTVISSSRNSSNIQQLKKEKGKAPGAGTASNVHHTTDEEMTASVDQKSVTSSQKTQAPISAHSNVKGPTLPRKPQQSAEYDRKSAQVSKSSGNKLEEPSPTPAKKKKIPLSRKVEYDESDPNYAMWMPPKGQSGDGRTSLNDKLGY